MPLLKAPKNRVFPSRRHQQQQTQASQSLGQRGTGTLVQSFASRIGHGAGGLSLRRPGQLFPPAFLRRPRTVDRSWRSWSRRGPRRAVYKEDQDRLDVWRLALHVGRRQDFDWWHASNPRGLDESLCTWCIPECSVRPLHRRCERMAKKAIGTARSKMGCQVS